MALAPTKWLQSFLSKLPPQYRRHCHVVEGTHVVWTGATEDDGTPIAYDDASDEDVRRMFYRAAYPTQDIDHAWLHRNPNICTIRHCLNPKHVGVRVDRDRRYVSDKAGQRPCNRCTLNFWSWHTRKNQHCQSCREWMRTQDDEEDF